LSDHSKQETDILQNNTSTQENHDTNGTDNLLRAKFDKITAFEEAPKPYFNDKDYYKKVLQNEGEAAKKAHSLITQFFNAKDPQDRTLYRNRFIPAYWDLELCIAQKIANSDFPICKKMLLRFGVLSPTFLAPEQKEMLSRVIYANKTGEPVHYLDEWLEKIVKREVHLSAQDEVKISRKSDAEKKRDIVEKREASRSGELTFLQNKIIERDRLEAELIEKAKIIGSTTKRPEYNGLKSEYNEDQKRAISGIPEILRHLSTADREIARAYYRLDQLDKEIIGLKDKIVTVEMTPEDTENLKTEFNAVRQMTKLCVGRQGNHFPILIKQYLRSSLQNICTRENVIQTMADIETLDPGLFIRTFKNNTTRVVPHVIILPCYGEQGICWEPFDRHNKAAGRGRIGIPMYPKDIKEAILYALADLRWQVAKEKAMHYWMEEGFTGRYYQWFEANKMKGDVKDAFIRDYVLWVTKESEGTQKLDKDVRGIFWRMLPFPKEIKEKLKNRGFVYNELYKKDMNILRSDGY
jgi:hypothetical protein